MKTHLSIVWLSGLLLFQSCSSKEEQKEAIPDDAQPVAVILAIPQYVFQHHVVQVAGVLASSEEARLGFKTGGVIREINAREGQVVRKGQVLATLDLTEINAQRSQAQLGFQKAERDYKRVQNLVKDTAGTLEQLENARTAYELAQQQASVAEFNQAYSRIISPLNGTVTRKFFNEGELVGPGSPVLWISSSQSDSWVLQAGVTDRDWASLAVGDQAEVYLDAYPRKKLKGKVSQLAQAADPVTRLYQVEVRVVPEKEKLAPGLFGRVHIQTSGAFRYLSIPVEALLEGQGNEGFVFVEEQGKAVKRKVSVGPLQGETVLIEGGIDSLHRVIVAGAAFLREGATLDIQPVH